MATAKKCGGCYGSGYHTYASRSEQYTCKMCNGSGYVKEEEEYPILNFLLYFTVFWIILSIVVGIIGGLLKANGCI